MQVDTRKMTYDESLQLKKQLISTWGFVEKTAMKWIALTVITLIPLLIFEKKVPPKTELIIVIIEQIVVAILIILWTKKDPIIGAHRVLKKEIENGVLEIIRIKSDKVVKRKDPEDFGNGYYFEIDKDKVIFLQGQHLDILSHERKFPNTDFEIIRTKNNKILIDYKTNGELIKPIRTLKAFSKEQYKIGDCHFDGQIIEININDLK